MKKRIAFIYRIVHYMRHRVAIAQNEQAIQAFLQEHPEKEFEIDLLEPLELSGHPYVWVHSFTIPEFQTRAPVFSGPDIIYQAYTGMPLISLYAGTFESLHDLHYKMKNSPDTTYEIKKLRSDSRGLYREIS